MSSMSPTDLNLDEASKKELAKFLENEQAKARVQQSVHTLTDLCWNKCIARIGNKFDASEETCLKNCVERFLDTSIHIVTKLQSNQGSF